MRMLWLHEGEAVWTAQRQLTLFEEELLIGFSDEIFGFQLFPELDADAIGTGLYSMQISYASVPQGTTAS